MISKTRQTKKVFKGHEFELKFTSSKRRKLIERLRNTADGAFILELERWIPGYFLSITAPRTLSRKIPLKA